MFQKAEGPAEFLGFEPISEPEERLAGALSDGLKRFLRGGLGVSELAVSRDGFLGGY